MLNMDDKFFEHPTFNFIITLRVQRKQAMLIIFEMICFEYKYKKCKNERDTGCSLNIAFFRKFKNIFWTLVSLGFSSL